MARSDAVSAVTGTLFEEGWSRIRGSRQGLGDRQKQLVRAARGHRAAVFKAIRAGGTHSRAQLVRQLEYLTTKASHIVDSRSVLDRDEALGPDEIERLADRFTARWGEGFNPKLGHTTHLLMSYPIGTRATDVRDISTAVAERFFANEARTFDYLIAVHEDRDHPHAHLVLNRRAQEGEYFYLGRDHHFNYDAFRLAMVEEAERVGVRLEATRRLDRGVTTYAAQTAEVHAAKEEGRAVVERPRVGDDLARAAAENAMTSYQYRALAAKASEEGREDIANALFRAGEILARNGRLEQDGDVYMDSDQSFEELRSRFAERADRVEALIRAMPEGERAAAEKQVNAIYADMAHMQPLGQRSSTLTQAPSDGGVYSAPNLNPELAGRMREGQTRAQIETALRGTGISSEAVISRVEQGAGNAALEREWLSRDLERIAETNGLNLERREDLRAASDRLDEVHVQLGTLLERAGVLKDDGVVEEVEIDDRVPPHLDQTSIDRMTSRIRDELMTAGQEEDFDTRFERVQGMAERGELESMARERIGQEQRAYLRDRPEIIASPAEAYDNAMPYAEKIVDRETFERVALEAEAAVAQTGAYGDVAEAVAQDFKARYPDMPDHLARGLGRTYAKVDKMRNDEAVAHVREERLQVAHVDRVETSTIEEVVARERSQLPGQTLSDEASRLAFRTEVERRLADEQLDGLREGDASALRDVRECPLFCV
jgi:type IV secretion system T-DNA border endonuclease VirD2